MEILEAAETLTVDAAATLPTLTLPVRKPLKISTLHSQLWEFPPT
jgi:hypothetical protein